MKNGLLGALAVVLWSVSFIVVYFLVALLVAWLCNQPGIGEILTFLIYRIAVKDWIIPLREIVLAFACSRITTPLIHRLMHDCTVHAVFVTKVVCVVVQVVFWVSTLIIGGEITFNAITQYIGLLIGIAVGCFVAEFYPASNNHPVVKR